MCNDFCDGYDGPDLQNWMMMIGPISEDIANEELEKEKARRDTLGENDPESEDPFADDEDIETDSDFDSEADW